MDKKKEIFETMPVPKALATLAIPTILSQLVTMIYSLADTFYIGQTKNPYMVAGISLSFTLFILINAIGNLFGIGGGSLISRMLGAKRPEQAKHICSFSFWTGVCVAAIYSIIVGFNLDPLLRLLGASDNTLGWARDYSFWVVVIGGVPSSVGAFMGHFLRSEGYAKYSSIGIAGGGILNIILDPIFIFGFGMAVKGAAIATMISNVCAMVYYFIMLNKLGDRTVLSVSPKYYRIEGKQILNILSVGFPAALATLLMAASSTIVNRLTASYGDIALAAMGVNKRIDMVPMGFGFGLSQGMMPLMAYNYAAKNYRRMHEVSNTGRMTALAISLTFITIYQIIPGPLVRIFINEPQTIELGAKLLRIACISVPFMQMNQLLNTTFQAMGKGTQSLILTSCRQGLINIPLLFLMNRVGGLYGLIWTQSIADALTLCISFTLYTRIIRKLRAESDDWDLKKPAHTAVPASGGESNVE